MNPALLEPQVLIFFGVCLCIAFLFGAYFGTAIGIELAIKGKRYETDDLD